MQDLKKKVKSIFLKFLKTHLLVYYFYTKIVCYIDKRLKKGVKHLKLVRKKNKEKKYLEVKNKHPVKSNKIKKLRLT